MSRIKAEKFLRLVLQVSGIILLCATPFIAVPHAWMESIHGWLGLGSLPDQTITAYLTRSESLLYATLGGATLCLAVDLERYKLLISYWAAAHLFGGAILLVIDLSIGMPWFWTLAEGPGLISVGLLTLVLQHWASNGRSTSSAE